MRRTPLLPALVLAAASARGQAGGPMMQLQQWSAPNAIRSDGLPVLSPVSDRPAKLLYAARPVYPAAYASKGVEGSVVMELTVLPDGSVADPKVIESPDPRLSQSAEEAVAQWLFQPALRGGREVAARVRVPLVFRPSEAKDDPEATARAAQARGERDLAGRDYIAAMAAFDQALRLSPGGTESVYGRGRARQGLGEIAGAALDFAEAIRLDPDDARFHLALGKIDLRQAKNEAARSQFDAAVQLSPDSAEACALRGSALAALGREDEALEDYNDALAADPANARALSGRQLILGQRSSWDARERTWAVTRYRTFQAVWSTVNQTYYDPTFGGVDWAAVREKYRLRLPRVRDNAQLRDLLGFMLAELKRTHFAILPREGAVFNPSERVRIGTAGTEISTIEGGTVVAEVRPGSPGAAAGLRPGDLVEQVDGVFLARANETLVKAGIGEARRGLYLSEYVQSRLEGPVGSKVKLGLSGLDGSRCFATVTCGPNDAAWSEPVGHFPSVPIRFEAKRSADGVAVLRFNVFVLPVLQRARAFLKTLRPGDGLAVDLRGNGGGVTLIAAGLSGWLTATEFNLGTMHSREGKGTLDVYPQPGAFAGPVAILIDGQSASTSEILAAGLQETGRARVFGEPSAGAALPSIFKTLPTGDLFQYAVADVTTPKSAVLEGRGVTPDERVRTTRADLAAGRDPVMAAARQWLASRRPRR